MKLMLVVLIILAIFSTLLIFGISKLYDYLKYKEDKYDIHNRNKKLTGKERLKAEEIKAKIKMNEELIEIYEDSISHRAESIELQEEINRLNKLITDIEGEK